MTTNARSSPASSDSMRLELHGDAIATLRLQENDRYLPGEEPAIGSVVSARGLALVLHGHPPAPVLVLEVQLQHILVRQPLVVVRHAELQRLLRCPCLLVRRHRP
ncbi:hypothetical protein DVH05_003820 [Phytophthora capsici]|nr:hypothetical protein DVH05_003818 [Phytophthora capsici]KAG1688306.1 hypothetical protein DVH05_003820 [Phytophthora capsici]